MAESLLPLPDPYYADDFVTLYCADNSGVLPGLSEVDLVFTSPPYNLGVSSGGGFGHYAQQARLGKRGGGGKWNGGDLASGYADHDDAMPPADYEAWQRDVLTACWNTLSDTGAIFYNHKPRVQAATLWTPLVVNPGLPAPFPLGLPARAIESTGPSLVLDPFAGSGTTLRAAKDAGVRSIGIEKSERYCEIAVRRLAQSSLFGAAA